MTELRFARLMKNRAPEPTPLFQGAMAQALEQIAREEARPPRRHISRRRVLAVALAALLILSVAVAVAWGRNVIDFFIMDTVTGSRGMIQKNLGSAAYAHCDITIREAAYDGMSLYILYAVQDRDATQPLGMLDPYTGERYMEDTRTPGMEADNVSWWRDGLWINGVDTDVPGMSRWEYRGTDNPGEMLCYQLWRLDQLGVYLNGQVEITLPLGERQPYETLTYDQQRRTLVPEEGVMTFTLDASIRDSVTVEHPDYRREIGGVTAWVSEAVYTPVQIYLTLNYQVPQAVLDAYIAQQGGQPEDELLQYTPMSVVSSWIFDMGLVDGAGTPVQNPTVFLYGCEGLSDSQAWFTFPAISEFPSELYLALYDDHTGSFDLSRSIRVR